MLFIISPFSSLFHNKNAPAYRQSASKQTYPYIALNIFCDTVFSPYIRSSSFLAFCRFSNRLNSSSASCSISLYISVFALINLCPRLRTVNNHHIKIIQSHLFKRLIDSCHRFFVCLMLCGNL